MSGNSKRAKPHYFDACIYLAYLRNEEGHYGKEALAAIGAIWEECQRGGASIITSTITLTEVLGHKLDAKPKKLFDQVTESGLHLCIDVEPTIARKARDYRDYYHLHPVKVPNSDTHKNHLTTPDAIHLATAVVYGCSAMLTFDGCRGKKDDHTIGLLWLGNKAATDDLVITMPTQAQRILL